MASAVQPHSLRLITICALILMPLCRAEGFGQSVDVSAPPSGRATGQHGTEKRKGDYILRLDSGNLLPADHCITMMYQLKPHSKHADREEGLDTHPSYVKVRVCYTHPSCMAA